MFDLMLKIHLKIEINLNFYHFLNCFGRNIHYRTLFLFWGYCKIHLLSLNIRGSSSICYVIGMMRMLSYMELLDCREFVGNRPD